MRKIIVTLVAVNILLIGLAIKLHINNSNKEYRITQQVGDKSVVYEGRWASSVKGTTTFYDKNGMQHTLTGTVHTERIK